MEAVVVPTNEHITNEPTDHTADCDADNILVEAKPQNYEDDIINDANDATYDTDDITAVNLYISEMQKAQDTHFRFDEQCDNIFSNSRTQSHVSGYDTDDLDDQLQTLNDLVKSVDQTCTMIYEEQESGNKDIKNIMTYLSKMGKFMQNSDAIIQSNLVEKFRILEENNKGFEERLNSIDQKLALIADMLGTASKK